MKKVAMMALLTSGLAAQMANAVEKGFYYVAFGAPKKSSFTVSLSGECSGKVNLPVTSVYYEATYQHDAGVIRRDETDSEFYIYTDDQDVYAYGESDVWTPQEKHMETRKDGKVSFSANYGLAGIDSSLWGLDDGTYDDQITCKGGVPFSNFLIDFGPYINRAAKPFTAKGSLTHSHDTATGAGQYKITFSSSGILEQMSQCQQTGDLLGEEYTVKCSQPKVVKIKVTANAEGESVPD